MSTQALVVARALAAFLAALAGGAQAHAQFATIVSGPGGPPPTQFYPIGEGPAPGQFEFADPNNRAVVHYATGAGAFEKRLYPVPDPDGDGDSDLDDLNFFLSNPVTLDEYFTVGAGPDWTDWHEEILTPGWEWLNASLDTPNAPGPPSNLVMSQLPDTRVDFYFDPLPPGTDVDIRKELVFTGTISNQDLSAFMAGEYSIVIREYPTSEPIPEPATAAVCLIGLAGVALRRGRRTA